MTDQNNNAACSQEMLEAAMKAAVANGMIARYADEATYLCNWEGMKAIISAALAASPAVPAVDALTRYGVTQFADGEFFEATRHGEYVKLTDVRALLATPSTAPDEQAKQDDPAHVMPPTRGTDSQHIAIVGAVARGLGAPDCRYDELDTKLVDAIVREVELALVGGFREGRNTKPDSSNLAAPEATSEQMGGAQVAIPNMLFDGHAVYQEVMANDPHRPRVNADQISDVLDAVVRLIRRAAPTTERAAAPAVLSGDALELVQRMRAQAGRLSVGDASGRILLDAAMMVEHLAQPRAAEGEATERKPLTDDQIAAIADRTGFMAKADVLSNLVGGDICLDFARAIEQHHGITGGGK